MLLKWVLIVYKTPNKINPYLSPYTYNNQTTVDSSLKAFKDTAYLYLSFIENAILRYLYNLKFKITNISQEFTVKYEIVNNNANFIFYTTTNYSYINRTPVINCYIDRNTDIDLINDKTKVFSF